MIGQPESGNVPSVPRGPGYFLSGTSCGTNRDQVDVCAWLVCPLSFLVALDLAAILPDMPGSGCTQPGHFGCLLAMLLWTGDGH